MLSYDKALKQCSQQLRNNMTDAERYLWSKLRSKQVNVCWFYRQKPIGEYIVDFYCPRAKLVIEVDGGQHFTDDGHEYDKARDDYLNSLGLKVLRFSNSDVLTNIEGVVECIAGEIPLNPPFPKGETPSPSPEGGTK